MEHLKITQNQGVVTVSLNRPERRNAFHPAMILEITKTFKKFAKDKNLRAVLLTGEGESFCSGGDLEWMKSMAEYSQKDNLKDAGQLYDMYWAIRSCPVPVVGRIFGHSFGGGLGLVCVCDIAAAETQTKFCFSEVKWGLVPAVISPFVVDRVQAAKAREWFLTAKIFTSDEALEGGLINFSGSIDEVDAYVEKTLNMILSAAPQAVRKTKALHQSYSSVNWKTARAKTTKVIAERRASAEGQKGLQAFLSKQTPKWSDGPYATAAKI